MKQSDGISELDIDELQSLCFKAFYKGWAAYTKYLNYQVIEKGNSIHCMVFGTFSQLSNLTIDRKYDPTSSAICYAPTIDLLHQFGFKHDDSRPLNLEA